ncbi:MAG TPA: family 43 glycosylhydrolase [Steroidobacteraceae bacterium]|nr:family 43 glycosylhydrolase [Steroidobacteraceae bacterium]
MNTRRDALKSLLVGGAGVAAGSAAEGADGAAGAGKPAAGCASVPYGDWSAMKWGKGFEGQRIADLGNGNYLNPVFSGDRPDPTILKDGDDYWMTFSSFDSYPGIVIWHSNDLVNWQPVGPALTKPVGSVWACDIAKHDGRYFVYFPARTKERRSNYVVHASSMRGPWSDPIDLELPRHIDPGHIVGEDGKRYLFLSGGDRVRLKDDGLATDGAVEHVYDPWRYPDDWVVESFSPEGPKVLRHGDYYYMITAVGGTAGPPTGHMVIAARSKSIDGPWENCPHNPLVRTTDAREKWWSRGHATVFEGPDHQWWSVYHGYENGYWTLGRQCLLDRIEWTADGWLRFLGKDLSTAAAKPRLAKKPANAPEHHIPLSDDFSRDKFGIQWAFYDPGADEKTRVSYEDGALVMMGKGDGPANCSPITCITGDQAYRCEVEIEVEGDATGGVLFFYNRRMYCGLGFNDKQLVRHRTAIDGPRRKPEGIGRRLWIRFENNRHIVTFHTSTDGKTWTKFDTQMEISGYHHNVAYDFLSVRPGLYAAGSGKVRFRNFRYTAF